MMNGNTVLRIIESVQPFVNGYRVQNLSRPSRRGVCYKNLNRLFSGSSYNILAPQGFRPPRKDRKFAENITPFSGMILFGATVPICPGFIGKRVKYPNLLRLRTWTRENLDWAVCWAFSTIFLFLGILFGIVSEEICIKTLSFWVYCGTYSFWSLFNQNLRCSK